MMNCSDFHWVVVGSVGESQNFGTRIAHWSGSYVLRQGPHVSFRRTFSKRTSTVKSDAPRIWSDRGVLLLAFLCDVRVNQRVCDVNDVDFRTALLLAWKIAETAVSVVISAIKCECYNGCCSDPPIGNLIRVHKQELKSVRVWRLLQKWQAGKRRHTQNFAWL